VSRSYVVVAVAGALALAAAGCGSDSGSSGAGSGSGAKPAAKPGAISMHGLKFDPSSATVKVGQKVTWTNDDKVDHNVTATSGAKFKSRAFGGGKTYSFTPRKPARIAYVCTLHPGMKATLVVKR
jgi:plastocyanin